MNSMFSGAFDRNYDSIRTEFELSGLDANELEFMTAYERRKVLEAAGLNPDEYDF